MMDQFTLIVQMQNMLTSFSPKRRLTGIYHLKKGIFQKESKLDNAEKQIFMEII